MADTKHMLGVIGSNHKMGELYIREPLVLAPERMKRALATLKEACNMQELVYLSTCNRVEFIYTAKPDSPPKADMLSLIIEFFCNGPHPSGIDASQVFYHHQGVDAVRHVFRTASSLDSMVVGETQILGQVKKAYDVSLENGLVGPTLNTLFHSAFKVAKRVRRETSISQRPVSIASVAARFMQKHLGSSHQHITFVGTGEMIPLLARYVAQKQPAPCSFVNRTLEKAQSLAEKYKGTALSLKNFLQQPPKTHILVTSTSAPSVIFDRSFIQRLAQDHHLLIIDLAVPRDVDAQAANLDKVTLYNLDNLNQIIEENHTIRQGEAEKAERLIERQVSFFKQWLDERGLLPEILELQQDIRDKGTQSLMKLLNRKLSHLQSNDKKTLQEWIQQLTNSLSKISTVNLKDRKSDSRSTEQNWEEADTSQLSSELNKGQRPWNIN